MLWAFLLAAALHVGCISNAFLFPRGMGADRRAPDGAEEVRIVTPGGRGLCAWFFRADQPRARVVMFNGNAGNIENRIWHGRFFSALGYDALIFDYSGFGKSEGRASVYALEEDALAAYDFAAGLAPVLPVALFGESLGSTCALRVAAKRRPLAVALEGALIPHDEIWRKFPWPFYPVAAAFYVQIPGALDSVANLRRAGAVPLFMVHGRLDEICDPANTERLAREAAGPVTVVLIETAGHMPLAEGREAGRAQRALGDFLSGVTARADN